MSTFKALDRAQISALGRLHASDLSRTTKVQASRSDASNALHAECRKLVQAQARSEICDIVMGCGGNPRLHRQDDTQGKRSKRGPWVVWEAPTHKHRINHLEHEILHQNSPQTKPAHAHKARTRKRPKRETEVLLVVYWASLVMHPVQCIQEVVPPCCSQ